MKLSWTSLKISIAGAKLSHLVLKDKIWDHGSMAEQARIIFYLVHKAKESGSIESLKKQCTISCFEKIKNELKRSDKNSLIIKPVIKELAIVEVQAGKNNKPDNFCALITGVVKDGSEEFKAECTFIRQGEWWLLDDMRHEKVK